MGGLEKSGRGPGAVFVDMSFFYMAAWALSGKLTTLLLAAIGSGASSCPLQVPSKVQKMSSEKTMKCEENDMAELALNVKLTASLVATAGSALSKSGPWRSRELQRTSGSHFWDPFGNF